jgi:hypothetical protein
MVIVIFYLAFILILGVSFWSSKNPTPDLIWAVENPLLSSLVGGAMFWVVVILISYSLKSIFK